MAKAEKSAAPFKTFEALSGDQGEAIKEGMERFMAFTGQFSTLSRDGMEAASESAKAAAKSVQAMNARGVTYVQNHMSATMEAGKSIAAAKSVQEAMELQAEYSKASMEAYIQEAGAMFNLMASAMREAVEPLNSHAGKMVEKFQAAS